jgi:hypothetical protein
MVFEISWIASFQISTAYARGSDCSRNAEERVNKEVTSPDALN